jgi:hypothetical protein
MVHPRPVLFLYTFVHMVPTYNRRIACTKQKTINASIVSNIKMHPRKQQRYIYIYIYILNDNAVMSSAILSRDSRLRTLYFPQSIYVLWSMIYRVRVLRYILICISTVVFAKAGHGSGPQHHGQKPRILGSPSGPMTAPSRCTLYPSGQCMEFSKNDIHIERT